MTDKKLRAIFDKHNFLTLAAESDYEKISKKALRLAKKIDKYNFKLLLEIEKECKKRGVYKMNLVELTTKLQTLCHDGHSLDEVVIDIEK